MAKKPLTFAKMHGLGNDFVIVAKEHIPLGVNIPVMAREIANRRTGIGCDQFIIYSSFDNKFTMEIYNQDGSSAKACGNATRCLSTLLYLDKGLNTINIEVMGRKIDCHVTNQNNITVNMGPVSFTEDWMPKDNKLWPILELYGLDPREVSCADIGNPHIIIFSNLSDSDKELLGRKLETSQLFPDGVNVNFATIIDDKINLLVWERGTGFTLACGSGACCSFAAAERLGYISSEAEVVFKLGNLKMRNIAGDILMTGPASLVARGEFYYE